MKKNIMIFILLMLSINLYSQEKIDTEIDALLTLEHYQEIVDRYGKTTSDSYQTLYNIGLSFYMLSDDENCLKYINLAISKDSANPAPYFIKGSTFNYMDRLEEAIPLLQKAISLEEDTLRLAQSYRNLGYSYFHLNMIEPSIDAYIKAINCEKEDPHPYIMMAQLYDGLNEKDKALEYYYRGKENVASSDKSYITILFNIGLFEQRKKNYTEAKSAYQSLIKIDPTDHHTYAKLIQCYNQTKEYDKVPPLKAVLYDAQKKGLIKDEELSDMFCIDQFKTKNISIQVFERYEEGATSYIYNKILFYILDNDNNIEYSIQTEYSPAAVAAGVGKYMLCAKKDGIRINYNMISNDNTSYETIKNAVISILEKS